MRVSRTFELSQEKTITLLKSDTVSMAVAKLATALPGCCHSAEQRNGVPGIFVVGREPGWVGGLGDLTLDHLLQGVNALALGIESEHEMHDCETEFDRCLVG